MVGIKLILFCFIFLMLLWYEQQIWIDIGESEVDKDRMLLELERECLEVYRRKVNEAANAKARLHQSVAAKEAELATLMASLGEHNLHSPVKVPWNIFFILCSGQLASTYTNSGDQSHRPLVGPHLLGWRYVAVSVLAWALGSGPTPIFRQLGAGSLPFSARQRLAIFRSFSETSGGSKLLSPKSWPLTNSLGFISSSL